MISALSATDTGLTGPEGSYYLNRYLSGACG